MRLLWVRERSQRRSWMNSALLLVRNVRGSILHLVISYRDSYVSCMYSVPPDTYMLRVVTSFPAHFSQSSYLRRETSDNDVNRTSVVQPEIINITG
jgi:hypothetical protein